MSRTEPMLEGCQPSFASLHTLPSVQRRSNFHSLVRIFPLITALFLEIRDIFVSLCLRDAKLFRVINGTLRSFLRPSQSPFIRRCQTSLPENSRGFIAGEEKCERESHELLPPSVGPAKLGQSSRPLINRIRGFPFERTSIESDRRRSSAATPFLPRPLSNSRGAADLFRGRA